MLRKAIVAVALATIGLAAGCGSQKVFGSLSVTGPTVTPPTARSGWGRGWRHAGR